MRIFIRTKTLIIRINARKAARSYGSRASSGNISKCPFFKKSGGVKSNQPKCPTTNAIKAPSSKCPVSASSPSKIIQPCKKALHQTPKSFFSAASDILGHPLYPKRDGLDEKEFNGGITWRHGEEFDYSHLNKKYLSERIGSWNDPASAEQLVSNLVKTLEMELTNKLDPSQWVSMATDVFRYRANEGPWVETQEAVDKGSYNILLNQADPKLYDTTQSFDESHETFFKAFPDGFMWEVLKVYSISPLVAFTWRHWGKFEGEFNGTKGKDELIEIYGFGTAKIRMPNENDSRIRFEEVEVWYDMDKFLAELNGIESTAVKDAGFGGTVVTI